MKIEKAGRFNLIPSFMVHHWCHAPTFRVHWLAWGVHVPIRMKRHIVLETPYISIGAGTIRLGLFTVIESDGGACWSLCWHIPYRRRIA